MEFQLEFGSDSYLDKPIQEFKLQRPTLERKLVTKIFRKILIYQQVKINSCILGMLMQQLKIIFRNHWYTYDIEKELTTGNIYSKNKYRQ